MAAPPPHFAIYVEVESTHPVVRLNAMNESEELRLREWVASHPELQAFVERALELQRDPSPTER
jgi:hypothetical protein